MVPTDHTAHTAQDGETSASQIEIRFQRRVTSLAALKRASYALLKELSVQFIEDKDDYVCVVTPNSKNLSDSESIEKILRLEVLDQELRLEIAEKTEPLRNLILANAFSKTGVIDSEQNSE